MFVILAYIKQHLNDIKIHYRMKKLLTLIFGFCPQMPRNKAILAFCLTLQTLGLDCEVSILQIYQKCNIVIVVFHCMYFNKHGRDTIPFPGTEKPIYFIM